MAFDVTMVGVVVRIIALIGVVAIALMNDSYAQSIDDETGRFFIDSFSSTDYDAHFQNWVINQAPNGLIYVGNQDGILEYDGVSWRLIPVSTNSVRALTLGPDGRMYVGAYKELGYLEPDSTGSMTYHSMVDLLGKEELDFSFIWFVVAVQEDIYFMGSEVLYRWRNGAFKEWRFPTKYNAIFSLYDDLYVHIGEEGLFRMEADSLMMAPGGELFADKPVGGLIEQGPDTYLAVVQGHGLFQCSRAPGIPGEACSPLDPALNERLANVILSLDNSVLPDGTIVLSTYDASGLVLISSEGELLRVATTKDGLPTNVIYSTFVDREGHLWLATDSGIARINHLGAASFYDQQSGLPGVVSGLTRHLGRLYAATQGGILVLSRGEDKAPPHFELLENAKQHCLDVISIADILLAGCDNKVYDVERGQVLFELPGGSIYKFHRSSLDTTRLYIGHQQGLGYADYRDGQWQYSGYADLNETIRMISEGRDGTIWALGYHSKTVHRITPGATPGEIDVAALDQEYEMPDGPWKKIAGLQSGEILWYTREDGVFRIHSSNDSAWVEPDFALSQVAPHINKIAEDSERRLWIKAGSASVLGHPQENGTYAFEPSIMRIIPGKLSDVMYAEENGVVWGSYYDRLTRMTYAPLDILPPSYTALIRRVSTRGDSLLFGGEIAGLTAPPAWSQDVDNLRFEYAAPGPGIPEENHYRTWLQGDEEEWTSWTNEHTRDFTNLSAGQYTFHVEARDLNGRISEAGSFSFQIVPPWYRTLWAHALWIALGMGALIGGTRAYIARRTQRLQEANLLLEEKVKERTESLHKALEEARVANETQARFLANVSHELRTPLTLIMSPLADLANETLGPMTDKALDHIHVAQRSAGRLYYMINDVLDLSRIEEGYRTSNKKTNDLTGLLRYLYNSFSILATQKDINFLMHEEGEPIRFSFDTDQIERVFVNLLANAFKYTPRGGAIRLVIAQPDPDHVQVSVKDNGLGISEHDQKRIFERFFRVDHTTYEPGTGIGLSYAKKIVNLHGGTIAVDSELDFGSTFTVTLPLMQEETDSPVKKEHEAVPMYIETEIGQLMEPAQTEEAEEIDPDHPSILVVDDNTDVRLYLKEQLASHYNVIEATDGLEALNKAAEYLPDVIVCDVMMPVLDGISFVNRLRNNPEISYLPVILVTANTATKLPGLEEGADDYLAKPFDMKELRLRIRNLISNRKKLFDTFSQSEEVVQVPVVDVSPKDEVFIISVQKIIEEHMGDSEFGVAKLADRMAQSRRTLNRRVKSVADMGPAELIRIMRLQRAAQLLEANVGSISDIAYAVGFKNVSYFSTSFSKHFGNPPSAFQAEKKRFGSGPN